MRDLITVRRRLFHGLAFWTVTYSGLGLTICMTWDAAMDAADRYSKGEIW